MYAKFGDKKVYAQNKWKLSCADPISATIKSPKRLFLPNYPNNVHLRLVQGCFQNGKNSQVNKIEKLAWFFCFPTQRFYPFLTLSFNK